MPHFIFHQNSLDGVQDYEGPACSVAQGESVGE